MTERPERDAGTVRGMARAQEPSAPAPPRRRSRAGMETAEGGRGDAVDWK